LIETNVQLCSTKESIQKKLHIISYPDRPEPDL
jgi:hypothetical protein